MLHHTRRWNRDHARGAAQRLAERRRRARLGERLRRLGRLERAGQGAAARDAVRAATARRAARDRRVDAAGGARARTPRVVASRWTDGETTLWALANRGDAYAGPVGELEVELPARGIAAFVGSEQVMVAGGGDASFPAREAVRVPAPVVRVDAVPDGFAAVEPRPLTAVFRRRETGAYGEAPYVEEWKPLPPRLHDFVEVERPAPRGRFAISVRDVTDRPRPRRGARVRRLGRRAAADRGRVAARRRGGAARPLRAARLELDRERALRRPHALRDPEGRLRLGGRGLRLVRRRRPAGAGVLAQAAAPRRRPGALAADRLPAGGRPAVRPLDGIRVVEAATLFAAPFAGMLLGDFGAEVIKIEHPRRPDPARGHGPSKDGEGLWFKSLGAEQAPRHARPLEAGRAPTSSSGWRRKPTSCSRTSGPGTLERWGLGWDELSAVNPRLVLARVTGFGQTGPVRAPARLRHARRGDERLRRAERRAGRAAAAAAARPRRRRRGTGDRLRRPRRAAGAGGDRGRPGRRHLARRAAAGAARAAAGRVRPARRAAAADRQPVEPQRAAQRLPHRRRRVGRGLGERRLGGGARAPARRPARPRRAAVVLDRRGTRAARGRDRRGGRALDRRARPRRRFWRPSRRPRRRSRRSTTRATSSPIPSWPRSARSRTSRGSRCRT